MGRSVLQKAAGVAAALAIAAAVAPAAVARMPRGAAPYGLIASNANFIPGTTVSQRAKHYRRLRRAGVRAVRVDINWLQVEPPGAPLHDYDFSDRDREVRAIARAHLKLIGILAYGHPDYSSLGGAADQTPVGGPGVPPFQLGSSRGFPPDKPADFARYAADTARHFRKLFPGEVIGWEVWNEENEGYRFWAPHEDPAAYARLLCATYPQLKDVMPRVPVVFGGMFFPAVADQPGMSAPDFLQAAYDSKPALGRCYDAMAYHPYAYPFTAPELEVPIRGSVLSAADQMRAVLRGNGDGHKPLWITEVGWPTHSRTYGVSERKQAQYVARMQAATFAQGLTVLTWYTYGDDNDPTGANQEAAFGFFRSDGTAKPSYRALRVFSRVFRGSRFARDRSLSLGLPAGAENVGGRGFALAFRRRASGGRTAARITALWLASESAGEGQGPGPNGGTAGPARTTVSVPTLSRRIVIVGYRGRRRMRRAHSGRLKIRIGPGPRYLIDRPPG